jgi:hypothetical protein
MLLIYVCISARPGPSLVAVNSCCSVSFSSATYIRLQEARKRHFCTYSSVFSDNCITSAATCERLFGLHFSSEAARITWSDYPIASKHGPALCWFFKFSSTPEQTLDQPGNNIALNRWPPWTFLFGLSTWPTFNCLWSFLTILFTQKEDRKM